MSRTGGRDDWSPYLDADEKIIWAGAPLPTRPTIVGTMARFLACGGVAVLCAYFAWLGWTSGRNLTMRENSLVVLLAFLGARFLYLAFKQINDLIRPETNTRYALTNRRGFIGRPETGAFKAYPIHSSAEIKLAPGSPGAVYFAQETIRGAEVRGPRGERKDRKTSIGFERIAEADEVYQMMRRIRFGEDARRDDG